MNKIRNYWQYITIINYNTNRRPKYYGLPLKKPINTDLSNRHNDMKYIHDC